MAWNTVYLSQSRSHNSVRVEALLREGRSISQIAREVGVSRQRVQKIKARLVTDYSLVTAPATPHPLDTGCTPSALIPSPCMKALTLHLTPAVHDALVEACEVTNRNNPEEPITIVEYVEELVINRVVELGLLRRNKRKS